MQRVIARAAAAGGRGRRRLPALVGRQPARTSVASASCCAGICPGCRSPSRTSSIPTVREYRRASATCIDASLKPLMRDYLHGLTSRLRRGGLRRPRADGDLAGRRDGRRGDGRGARSTPSTPGPRWRRSAGRYFAARDAGSGRRHRRRHRRHQLRREPGPRRGASPGPARPGSGEPFRGPHDRLPLGRCPEHRCRRRLDRLGRRRRTAPRRPAERRARHRGRSATARAGREPTVTDCALLLGYIDPDFFLGGAMRLDLDAARGALERACRRHARARPSTRPRAAVLAPRDRADGRAPSRTSRSTRASTRRSAVLVGGGGAAGLNASPSARRLGCAARPDPRDRSRAERRRRPDVRPRRRARPDAVRAQRSARRRRRSTPSWRELEERCRAFVAGPGEGALESRIEYSVEARYPHQIWEIEVPLRAGRFADAADVARAGRGLPRHASRDLRDQRSRVGDRARDVAGAGALPPRARRAGGRLEAGAGAAATEPPAAGPISPGAGWVEAKVPPVRGLGRGPPGRGPGDRRILVHHGRDRSGRGRAPDGAAAALSMRA